MTNTIDPNTLPVTEAEAAQRLGISTSALRKWRRSGRGPAWITVGSRNVRYLPTELANWLCANTRRASTGGAL